MQAGTVAGKAPPQPDTIPVKGRRSAWPTTREAHSYWGLGTQHGSVPPDPDGPHIYIAGVFRGGEVLLQVLAQALADEEPELKFDTTRKPRQLR